MKSKKVTLGILIFYIIALVWIILFKFQFSFGQLDHLRSINLIPFAGSVIVNGKVNFGEIIQNGFAFVPFGILISSLWKEKTVIMRIAPICGVSLIFEILQFIFAVGASDITDLIMNTFGGIVGIGIYFLFSNVFKSKCDTIINIVSLCCAVLLSLFLALVLVSNL